MCQLGVEWRDRRPAYRPAGELPFGSKVNIWLRKLDLYWLNSVLPRPRNVMLLCALLLASGCGTTREKLATDQLLLSDAVDRAVANIDFSPLSNETVYLDPQFIKPVKGQGFVNSDYIISSLRQHMLLAGCRLQEEREDAAFVVEPRVGALGSDGHDVNYGLPASQGLNSAAALVTGTPPLPILPEISLARKTDDSAAAKIAVFAYHRESRLPVWQSGTSVARSTAYGKWIFGAGPFLSGSIYEGSQLEDRVANSTPLKRTREKNEPSPMYSEYRSPAVLDSRLQDKLIYGEYGIEHVANLPGRQQSGDKVDRGPPPPPPQQ